MCIRDRYRLAAWVLLLLTVIYLIVMCLARKKIRLAATLVKESTIIVKERASSLLFPFVIIAAQIPIVLYFFFVLILLGTADLQLSYFISGADGIVSASSSYADAIKAVNVSSLANGGLPPDDPWWVPSAIYLYFLFCVLWALESVKNIGWTALSGNVSDWYFFRRDEKMRTRFPLFSSLYRVLRYHLGSIFFGSFIIALVKFVRYVLMAIQTQADKVKDKKVGMILKLALCCVSCCLYCLEKTLKYITNFAYIYTAMQGSGFCGSCKDVFKLLLGHMGQMAINAFVQRLLHAIQSWGIPFLSGWVAYEVLGILGVGTPEVLVVAAVGYFLLGPEELFKLSKEIGKVVAQVRTYVTDSAAEWQSTFNDELDFKEVKEIQAAAQELQEAFNFRSSRYQNDYSNFNSGADETYDPLSEPPASPMLDVDDWNAKILADEAAAAPLAASQASAVAAEASAAATAVAAPPAAATSTKAARLAEVERLYEAKRRALELEFGYERDKLAIELEDDDA